jgi:hypothetical protein
MTKAERMKMAAESLREAVMQEKTGTLLMDCAQSAVPRSVVDICTLSGAVSVATGVAYALDCTGTTMGIAGASVAGAMMLIRSGYRAKEEWSELIARATGKREVVDGVRHEVEPEACKA